MTSLCRADGDYLLSCHVCSGRWLRITREYCNQARPSNHTIISVLSCKLSLSFLHHSIFFFQMLVTNQSSSELSVTQFAVWMREHCPRLLDGMLHWVLSLLRSSYHQHQDHDHHAAANSVSISSLYVNLYKSTYCTIIIIADRQ